MSGIAKIGLRLVETIKRTKCITKNNTTKNLRSMFQVKNGFKNNTKNSIPPAQKKSAGFWKIIKIYSLPLSIIGINSAIYYIDKIKSNPEVWLTTNMKLEAIFENLKCLKYSITPSKLITSSVLFNDSEIEILTQEEEKFLKNDNTRNLIINKELEVNLQKPFPRGEPVPITIGKYTGLLDNGKLILKTEDGKTTYTIDHQLSLKVKKSSEALQNETAAASQKVPRKIIESKIGEFNVSTFDSKLLVKTSNSEKKWMTNIVDPVDIVDTVEAVEDSTSNVPRQEVLLIDGNFNFSFHGKVKIQADNSDEVYYFKQRLYVKCDRKLDENLQIKNAADKELPRDAFSIKAVTKEEMLEGICQLFDSGTVVFKTQDGSKIVLRQIIESLLFENNGKTGFRILPFLTYEGFSYNEQ